MQQPSGFVRPGYDLLCKLNKAIYGLKQALKAWFERLLITLHQLGFITSKCDPSLFTLTTPSYTILMLVYVDDPVITRNSPNHTHTLVTKLNTQFSLKQLDTLNYFLGTEFTKTPQGGLFLSQTKYSRHLLAITNMSEAKSLSSPMVSNLKFIRERSNHLSYPTYYRLVVRALKYVTITRP